MKISITQAEAKKHYVQNGHFYTLEVIFDAGFQNEFHGEEPEETCVLDMTRTEAEVYVVEETDWFLEKRDNGIYLVGENQIGGFGFGEDKVDETAALKKDFPELF